MATRSDNEFANFVDRLVPVDDDEPSGSTFERLMGRVTRPPQGSGRLEPLLPALLLLAATALVASLPSTRSIEQSQIWKLADGLATEILAFGRASLIPLLVASVVAGLIGAAMAVWRRGEAPAVVLAYLSLAGLSLAVVLWVALAALWVVNLGFLLAKVVLFFVACAVGFALFLSMLWGALTG